MLTTLLSTENGTSLESPDSFRAYELLLPNDSQTPRCGRGLGGKPVSPASFSRWRCSRPSSQLRMGRHLRARIHSGRMSCYFPTTPRRHVAEGGWGGNLFPPHLFPGGDAHDPPLN